MSSDKRNSIGYGLDLLLFNVASSLDVPFGTLQYVQYILNGLTRALLCVPFNFSHNEIYQFVIGT